MPRITLTTKIAAPLETVFDLARSVDLHVQSMGATNERAVAGRTSGLVEVDESITWEATHFLVRQRLTVKITQLERPSHFRDTMVSGAFRRFDHDHRFEFFENVTTMTDQFDFDSPFEVLGHLANSLFLTKYMRKLLEERNELIKQCAESGDSETFLNA